MTETLTLDELRDTLPPAMGKGRPNHRLTDEKWQEEFKIRKLYIKPYPANINRLSGTYIREGIISTENSLKVYDGQTNYQSYSAYINSVLSNIRLGAIDFCYFKYQIIDLARFHLDSLRTKYIDGYWQVWLER